MGFKTTDPHKIYDAPDTSDAGRRGIAKALRLRPTKAAPKRGRTVGYVPYDEWVTDRGGASPIYGYQIPIRLRSEANQREHWGAKANRVKAQRVAVSLAMQGHGDLLRACLPAVVRITRIGPRDLDSDNLQGAAKAVRDAVASVLGVDDADPAVTWEPVQQDRGKYGVRIVITRKERP